MATRLAVVALQAGHKDPTLIGRKRRGGRADFAHGLQAVAEESEGELTRRLPGYSWSLMRSTLQNLALDGTKQVKNVAIEDFFDWDPAYPMVESWCASLGWVSPELHAALDRVDELLDQISDDKTTWTDEAITRSPRSMES